MMATYFFTQNKLKMKHDVWNESAVEFFEGIVLRYCNLLLPGGKRWLRLHEVEKLIDIPKKELLLMIKERKIGVAYIGDYEIFDYTEICEMMEGLKCFNATPLIEED